MTDSGEQKAWDALSMLRAADVCRAAAVNYDTELELYTVRSFGKDIVISPKDRTVSGCVPGE